jgi:hypothetical protein
MVPFTSGDESPLFKTVPNSNLFLAHIGRSLMIALLEITDQNNISRYRAACEDQLLAVT